MEKIVKETLEGLKDFQLKSVEHLFSQLYNNGKQRVLLADEVGLGKTIVAKGIIAKAYQHYLETANKKLNPTFNVVYICSNQALAKQNITKLNFTKDEKNVDTTVDRLIHLARTSAKTNNLFLIQALTPSISFENRGNFGEVNERAIIFNLITYYDVFNLKANKRRNKGLYKILQGKAGDAGWQNAVCKTENQNLQNDLYGKFRKCLLQKFVDESTPNTWNYLNKKGISIWHLLSKLAEVVDGRNLHLYKFVDEITRLLRKELTKLCIKYLGADIFILDEFQRFSQIIKLENQESENQAVEIARAIFADPDAKTLLLSATPFKPYTSGYDHINGEVHQKEFDDVLKFLMNVTETNSENWLELIQERKQFFNYLLNTEQFAIDRKNAIKIKNNLEQKYFDVMLRTERLLASEDNNSLMKDVMNGIDSTHEGIRITSDDIEDFVALDKLTQYLNNSIKSKLPIPVEYVKSCPFALSFLQEYQHHKKLIEALETDDKELLRLLKDTKSLWLNTKAIDNYKNLLPNSKLPNAKIRVLTDEAIGNNGWELLWIPPTVQYYQGGGAFKNSGKFSKILVFSAWKMVPRMIATLISYEVERKSFANIEYSEEELSKGVYFSGKRRKPFPLIVFPMNEDGTKLRLNNFVLKYPCLYLAKCYDPLSNANKQLTIQHVIKNVEILLKPIIIEVIKKYGKPNSQFNSTRWQWALPILLDKEHQNNELSSWLNNDNKISESIIEADDANKVAEDSKGEKRYLQLAKDLFNGINIDLPLVEDARRIDELVNFAARLSIGSASICAIRTLTRLHTDGKELINAAYEIGNSFITLYNKPESIAVVRNTKKDENYANEVLDYAINGNIQAMLDEYCYMLQDAENLSSANAIANHIADILSVRTTTVKVDDYNTIRTSYKDKPAEKNMRCHYAVNFGGAKLVAGKSGKEINVRQAFNSPFRPFVLASTSIGQEGLDFHLYCRKIFHWNLPHNPIDFEQREGRINRYKSHVIRQNLVDKYSIETLNKNPKEYWRALFEVAEKEKMQNKSKSDLVPFWHTETQNNIKIERFVPLLPFSRDIDKYKNLLKVLTYYRLTFGQARQDELIDALDENIDKELLNSLLINLSSLNLHK